MGSLEASFITHQREDMRGLIKNLKIEKIVNKGLGLGFSELNPVFVSHSVPEDVVDVEVAYKKKQVIFADIKDIRNASEYRISPECEVFGECGGCDWLHIAYKDHPKFKNEILKELYKRVGIIPEILSAEKNIRYRNKTFMPVGIRNGEPVIGIFSKRSHQVVPHSDCLILPELFNDFVKELLLYIKASGIKIYDEVSRKGNLRHIGIRYSESEDKVLLILVTKTRKLPFSGQLIKRMTQKFTNISGIIQNINPNFGNRILGSDEKVIFGESCLTEKIDNKMFKLNYNSFFQVNLEITKKIYDFVAENVSENSKVIDAFSGVGSIGIYLSGKANKLYLIENNPEACKNAEQNLKLNNITNGFVINGNTHQEIEKILQEEEIDTIIFDPPRKGLEKRTVEILLENTVDRIIYVSCDPATQVRDLLLLQKKYEIVKVKAFDMFPQTFHIETLAILQCKK